MKKRPDKKLRDEKSTEAIIHGLRGALEKLRQRRGITVELVSRKRHDEKEEK
jgi:hypothetical protein